MQSVNHNDADKCLNSLTVATLNTEILKMKYEEKIKISSDNHNVPTFDDVIKQILDAAEIIRDHIDRP